jgi:hypothetical protein
LAIAKDLSIASFIISTLFNFSKSSSEVLVHQISIEPQPIHFKKVFSSP